MAPWIRGFLLFAFTYGLLFAQSSGIPFYSLEKEVALGRQLAEETRKRTTSVENMEVQEYAVRIGKRLIAPVRSPFSWSFDVVTGLPDNPTEEPLELPGGFLFIPADLFLATNDESEFAGMLAHAIAHVLNRDMTRAALTNPLANYGTIPLIFMGGWQNGSAIPQGLIKTARIFEAHADVAAVEIMSRAGFDPHALVRYIERVQPETTQGQSPFARRDARVAALEAAIQALGADDGFSKVQEHLRKQVGEAQIRKTPSLFPQR